MTKNVNTKVGELKIRETTDDRTGEVTYSLRGVFHTLQNSLAIQIEPLERDPSAPRPTDDTPTHRVSIEGRKNADLGVAWERNIERGDYAGRPMFSIALNHPEMPDWAGQLAAFPRGNAGEYHLIHQRSRQPAAPQRDDMQHAGEDDIPA